MIKSFLSSYFSFTKKERTGIFVLTALIILFTVLPFLFPFFIKEKKYDHNEFQKEIAALKTDSSDTGYSKKYFSKKYDDDNNNENSYMSYNEPSYKKEVNNENADLFYFDPNTLNVEGWQKLGVKNKIAQNIQKYLSKNGRFHKPEDISKIWGLSDNMINRLMPYVKITDVPTASTQTSQPAYEKKEYKKEINPVDINLADTTAFIALPGIGNKLANRIVTFREKLGGFYKIEQVGETFALPDSTFQKIKPRLILTNNSVKQININTATIDELKAHPYIRYQIGNAIIQYRTQHGNFSSIEDIKKIVLVTDEIFNKTAPYLKVN